MRSVWNGSIVFGLASIPIKLGSASENTKISFKTLHAECGTPIKQLKWCPSCELVAEETVPGYEYEKGKYLPMGDSLDQLALISDKTITINEFVPSVNPMFFDKNYYVMPPEQPASAKIYGVLRDAMLKTGMTAIGQFTMREREHLAAIWPTPLALVLTTLHYHDEVRSPDFSCPGQSDEAGLALAEQAISMLAAPALDMSKYHDKHDQGVRSIIYSKLNGADYVPTVPEPLPQLDAADWLDQLRLSVEEISRRKEVASK